VGIAFTYCRADHDIWANCIGAVSVRESLVDLGIESSVCGCLFLVIYAGYLTSGVRSLAFLVYTRIEALKR